MHNLLTSLLGFVLAAGMAHADDSLYARLGGETGVAQITSEYIDAVANDPTVNQSFEKVNLERLKKMLAEFTCSLTGGGCVYSGDDMKIVHKNLKITEREFNALVEALRISLDRHGIAQRDKNALLAILAPMKRDVVEK
ncbi:MAG: group I truncated hemoglobin [Thiobacillus sp.]